MKWKLALLGVAAALGLAACGQPQFAEYALDGGAVCRVWGSEEGLRRLEVTDAAGEVRKFSLGSVDIEPDPAGGLTLIDLDFDGHQDVQIKVRQNGETGDRYACFLWRDGTLEKNDTLGQLRGLEVDAESQTLTAWSYYTIAEEHESKARLTYVWHEGKPVAVAKTELLYYFEEDIYCRVDYAAEPGEALAVVEEKWIFAEQFDQTKIWN